jgi:PAS domain S-box-containing protein
MKKTKEAIILIGFLCLFLVIMCGTFWIVLFQNDKAIEARDESLEIQETINEIHILSSKLKSAVLAHHRYLLTGDEAYIEEYKSLKSRKLNQEALIRHVILQTSTEDDLERLAYLTQDDPVQSARIEEIKRDFELIWTDLDKILADKQAGRTKAANSGLRIYLNTRVGSVRAVLRDVLNQEVENLNRISSIREEEASNRLRLILSIIGILFFIKMVLFSWATVQWGAARRGEEEIKRQAEKLQATNESLSILNCKIRESHEIQMRAVIDHAMDGQIMMDAFGNVINANAAAQKMFQYDLKEIQGMNISALLAEPSASESAEHLRQHRENNLCNETDHRHESVALRKNGTTFPIDLSMTMFMLGEKLHFSWFVRDITDFKKHEEDRRQYMLQLEASNKELDDFAYIASHDLKEPLRGLYNHARFLAEDYDDKLDEDGKKRLQRLLYLSNRMERLVGDLLYYSRLGRTEMSIQETDLSTVLSDIRHTIDSMLVDSHAEIRITTPLPKIVCDRVRITEVFQNLIVNAIKYNDKASKCVEISYRPQWHRDGEVEEHVFAVKDNGIGIEPVYFEDIFHIFKRLKPAAANDLGTGSGLTFVRKIVQQHGGKIWLESTPGVGTTFYFNLAMKESAHEPKG